MREVWDQFKADMRAAVDDFHESSRKAATKFSDKAFRKNLRRNPNAEWVYAETQSTREVKQLLANGWEIVSTANPKGTAIGSRASLVYLRKRNPGWEAE